MDKQYKTRSGIEVRILCIDSAHDSYPVVAIINSRPVQFTKEGHFWLDGDEHEYDLIEALKETILFIEVFTFGNGHIRTLPYTTKEALEESIKVSIDCDEGYQLIATKQITIVEGERV